MINYYYQRGSLIFGGEVLQTELVDSILASGTTCQLVNQLWAYSETTIGKLLHVADYRKYLRKDYSHRETIL